MIGRVTLQGNSDENVAETFRRAAGHDSMHTTSLVNFHKFHQHFTTIILKTILFFQFHQHFCTELLLINKKNLHDLCPKLGPLGKHLPNPVYTQKNQKKYYFKKLLEIFC